MLEVTKIIEWDMGHRVPNHKSKCRNPHGHRYRLEVTVGGRVTSEHGTSSEGMVYDFGDLKRIMLERIHDVVDHGFMVYDKDELLLDFFDREKAQGFRVIVVPFVPTAENIAVWCHDQIAGLLPAGIRVTNVRVYETPNSWADYKPRATP